MINPFVPEAAPRIILHRHLVHVDFSPLSVKVSIPHQPLFAH